MQLKIAPHAKKALDTLTSNGFEGYIVGGAVRDLLRGEIPLDYDIATNATPNEVQGLFTHSIPTGLQHGTVTVIIDQLPIEITTYRIDGDYNDARHPTNVEFSSSINDDLHRRDFTINALAYNGEKLIDLFGGLTDIENRTIKTVGNPDTRFNEDALRILRAFRFSATLGFEIETKTLSSCFKNANLLQKISRERIFNELTKALCGKFPQALQPLLTKAGLEFLGICINDISPLIHINPKPEIRYAALCKLSNNTPQSLLLELRASNKLTALTQEIFNVFLKPSLLNKTEIKLYLSKIPTELWNNVIDAYGILNNINVKETKLLASEITKHKEPYTLSMLAINGDELLRLGIPPLQIGKTLHNLLLAVIKNPLLNEKSLLLELAKNKIGS